MNLQALEKTYTTKLKHYPRMITAVLSASGLEHFVVSAQRAPERRSNGVLLENLTWVEAKNRLSADTVVIIALGAAAKEHGPHLKLATDWIMAEYFKRRVMERADVVVAPTVNYHFYPAFVNYPGSTSLRQDTARDLIIDICRTLAAHGPKRFYVLNTGVSTQTPLKAAQALLALDGRGMSSLNPNAVAIRWIIDRMRLAGSDGRVSVE